MKYAVACSLAISSVLVCAGLTRAALTAADPAAAATEASDDTKATDAQKHFETEIPDGWEKAEAPEGVALMLRSPVEGADDTFRENVNFIVTALPADGPEAALTLDQLAQAGSEQTQASTGAKLHGEIEKSKMGDEPTRVVSYDLERDGVKYVLQQTFALHKKQVYIVTYTATGTTTKEMNDAAKSVIEHVKFLGE